MIYRSLAPVAAAIFLRNDWLVSRPVSMMCLAIVIFGSCSPPPPNGARDSVGAAMPQPDSSTFSDPIPQPDSIGSSLTSQSISSAPRSQAGSNEPPGFLRITERGFSSREESGWESRPGDRFRIVQDPSAPHSPPDVGEASYPRGFRAGSGPINTYFDPDPKFRKLYISFWMQMSDNWFGNRSGVNKVLFVWIHDNPSVVLTAFGQARRPLLARIGLQGLPRANRNLVPVNERASEVQRGAWTHWETVLEANTPGVPNGVARWWINGVQVGNYTDIMFSGPRQAETWGRISWNPTYGGRQGDVPDDQFMRFDHIYVSGQQ
jgi:hypothetical protein